MQTRRAISGILGSLPLAGTLAELVWGSSNFYVELYAMPTEKYGVLTRLRRQDIVFLIAFYLISIGLLYLSFRLLKSAFGHRLFKTV